MKEEVEGKRKKNTPSLPCSPSLSPLDCLFPSSTFIGAKGDPEGASSGRGEQDDREEVFRGRGERERVAGRGAAAESRRSISIQFKFFNSLSLTLESIKALSHVCLVVRH